MIKNKNTYFLKNLVKNYYKKKLGENFGKKTLKKLNPKNLVEILIKQLKFHKKNFDKNFNKKTLKIFIKKLDRKT